MRPLSTSCALSPPERPSQRQAQEATTVITDILDNAFEKALADQHISHREAREIGRELGIKLAAQFHHLADQSHLRHLLATSAESIYRSPLTAENQASCWSNLRKGFIGDTESFHLGQARSAAIDSVEEQLPHLRSMFYRYPNPDNPGVQGDFDKIRDQVREHFPHHSHQSTHEAALILYGMAYPRGTPLVNTAARFDQIAESLLAVCETHLQSNPTTSLVSLLRPLSRIASIYEKASSRISNGQRCQTSFREATHRPTNRLDLLGRINRVEQLVALISPAVQTAASALVSRGSYVGRLYLDTVTDYPHYQGTLHCSYPQTRHVLETHYRTLVREPRQTEPAKTFSLGAPGLKEFTATSYINIGLECLNQEPHNPSFHSDSSRDVALLSEFIFQRVVGLEYQRLASIHGTPSSRYGVLAGGANARGEYPSFDYDWFLTYENEGETSAGHEQVSISNQAFYTKLARAINSSLNYLGANSDGAYFPYNPITLVAETAVTQDRYARIVSSCPDPHMELRLRVTMVPLAGDPEFCRSWLTFTQDLVRKSSAEIMQNQAKIILETAHTAVDPRHLNIKTSPGGLRLGTHLWILTSVAFDRNFDSFDDLIQYLQEQKLVSNDRAMQLVDSYHYLLRLRVRMDMQYGRNDKDLPRGDELGVLAKTLGIHSGQAGVSPETDLHNEIMKALTTIQSIIGGTLDSDQRATCDGIIHALRHRVLSLRNIDIFNLEHILDIEERSRQIRLDFVSQRAARAENLWLESLNAPGRE